MSGVWEKTWALLPGESCSLLHLLTGIVSHCRDSRCEWIPRSVTEFVGKQLNLGKQLFIHGHNFSFAQQRENASIFCPFPVKTFFVVGTVSCLYGIKHHQLLLVELTAPVVCIIRIYNIGTQKTAGFVTWNWTFRSGVREGVLELGSLQQQKEQKKLGISDKL